MLSEFHSFNYPFIRKKIQILFLKIFRIKNMKFKSRKIDKLQRQFCTQIKINQKKLLFLNLKFSHLF